MDDSQNEVPTVAEQRDRWREAKAQFGDSIPPEAKILILEGELSRVHAKLLRLREECRRRGAWKQEIKNGQAKKERHYAAIRDENGVLWERLRRHADAAKIVRLLDHDEEAERYFVDARTVNLLGLDDAICKLRGEPTARPPTYGKRDA